MAAKKFDKVVALDNLMTLMSKIEKPTLSQQLTMIVSAQNTLQSIYDEGFRDGFDRGIDEQPNNQPKHDK